jgi:hypothetical protein
MPCNELSIDRYDELEREARIKASYPEIRAFSPLTFSQVNFPARVSDERELIRYADIMYELLPREQTLSTKAFSKREALIINQMAGQIADLTEKRYGRRIRPLMCLFPQVPILRAVEWLAQQAGRRLTVMEIGPGSGHFGGYIINMGHRYIAADITQALYLWQNRLFGDIAESFTEYASAETIVFTDTQAHHIPWWHLSRLHKDVPFQADVVVCDAAIGEMDSFAVPYILRISREILKHSNVGCFLYQNVGVENVTPQSAVRAQLERLGFKGAVASGVSVFALDAALPPRVLPTIGTEASLLAPIEFLDTRGSLLESYEYFDFIGRGN